MQSRSTDAEGFALSRIAEAPHRRRLRSFVERGCSRDSCRSGSCAPDTRGGSASEFEEQYAGTGVGGIDAGCGGCRCTDDGLSGARIRLDGLLTERGEAFCSVRKAGTIKKPTSRSAFLVQTG